MLDEMKHRRRDWTRWTDDDGRFVPLADGQAWFFPRPSVIVAPAFGPPTSTGEVDRSPLPWASLRPGRRRRRPPARFASPGRPEFSGGQVVGLVFIVGEEFGPDYPRWIDEAVESGSGYPLFRAAVHLLGVAYDLPAEEADVNRRTKSTGTGSVRMRGCLANFPGVPT